MEPLIECVPNISEGRRPALVAHLVQTVAATGATLLDRSSDTDHHRTVLTLAGSASVLADAVEALAAAVFTNVDLRRHRGVHPRLGALDVVPFVPLADASMADAVTAAETVAERLARRFEIPVCLYGEAAHDPDRRALAALRRGGVKRFVSRLRSGEVVPEAGPAKWDARRGIVAVGARGPLVGFNVVLRSKELDLARQIARRVRERSGGLPTVRALGLPLASKRLVQVSMNLEDPARVSVHAAFERVAEEAEARGVEIVGSEIVGLAPRQALQGGRLADLRLLHPAAPRVLETRLAAAGL